MPNISVKISILKAHTKYTVGFEYLSGISLERGIKQTEIPWELFHECLNSILLLAQGEIIQGQTCLYSMTCSRPGTCQSCLIIYSDGDSRHTKGNGRNMSKAQALLFCHIIAFTIESFISSVILWYKIKHAQNSFSLL